MLPRRDLEPLSEVLSESLLRQLPPFFFGQKLKAMAFEKCRSGTNEHWALESYQSMEGSLKLVKYLSSYF
jgi:hypothetical protein